MNRSVSSGMIAIALMIGGSLPATAQSVSELQKAEAGDPVRQLHLGFVYLEKRNYRESEKWFKRAANNGDGTAASVLHMCYRFVGLCPEWPSNRAESDRWYGISQRLPKRETVRADDGADYNGLKDNFLFEFNAPLNGGG